MIAVAIIAIVMLIITKRGQRNEIQMVTNERGFTINRLEEENPVYEQPSQYIRLDEPPQLPPPRKIINVDENPPLYDLATMNFAGVTYDDNSDPDEETSS